MIIVLFHVLYLFGKFVYQNYRIKKQKAIDNDVTSTQKPFEISERDYRMRDPDAPQDFEQKSVKFFPPAYVQRYIAVSNVLNSPKYQGKLRKVVDFGCAELDFLVYLKNTTGVEEILCVDIDRVLLESYKNKGAPLISEYLHTRTTPLVVEICEGSVTHNDKKLEKTDAVICIELIEHLYPETLTNFPYNIFGFIKPKLAIVTTPNADFNVLFPNFSGFRHPDHKFEWTREQFQDWAENIILRYPDYIVTFDGIGKGPDGSEHLGQCTQMAVFHRLSEKDSCNVGIEGLFVTVAKHDYPFQVDNRSDEQKILDEAEYYIRHLSFQDNTMEEEVPLKKLLDMLKTFHISVEMLQSILEDAGWTVSNREFGPVVLVPPRSTFSDYSTVGEAFPPNDYSDDDDDWNREPGPPIGFSRFSQQNIDSDGWDNENWNDEPSIVIPQNNSVVENNSYLFDEENVLSNNISEAIRDMEMSERYSETNSEENLDTEFSQSSNNHTGTNVLNHSFRCDLSSNSKETSFTTKVKNLKSDPFLNLTYSPEVQRCAVSNTSSKLDRTSDCLPYISVSCASTSPEPYLLQTIKMDQQLKHDSMYNQSMGNHWMLNSSLEQVDESLDVTANEDSKLSNNSDDNRLRNIYVNTSYKDEDSDIEFLSNSESTQSKYFSLDQAQSVQSVSKENSQLQLSGSVSFANCALTEDGPQFTSSPKVNAKVNTSDKKRRSLDCSKQKNSSGSLKRLQQSCLNLGSNNSLKSDNESEKSCEDVAEMLNELTDNDDTLASSEMSVGSTMKDSSSLSNANKLGVIDTGSVESTNCDKEVPLAQLIVRSEPCTDFVRDKTEAKSESDICNLRSNRNVDTTKSTNNHAKECVPSVQNVQSTSVLKYERQSENVSLETVEGIELKASPPETVETPPKSWSPEVMDSGYPNSASAQDITPEYDLSSIAQDHISDSEPPSIAEAPRLEVPEVVEVENGDLVNNNRDNEGNNMMAAELNDLEDLQPLIDVIENDLENENDIYVLENGFPLWLLRILNMAIPIDHREVRFPNGAAGDARYANMEHDEGFNSSSEENSNLGDNELRHDDDNSDASDNIENDNENISHSDSGSEEWAAAGDS